MKRNVQLNVHDVKKCPVAKLADKSYSQRDKIARKLKVLYIGEKMYPSAGT